MTFFTPWGRYCYRKNPGGFVGVCNGCNRRFDTVLEDFERKEWCADDVIFWDRDLEEHWWRMIAFLESVARVLNNVTHNDRFCVIYQNNAIRYLPKMAVRYFS